MKDKLQQLTTQLSELNIKKSFLFLLILFLGNFLQAQNSYILSTEGYEVFFRRNFVNNCLSNMNKTRDDVTMLKVCECVADRIDGEISMKKYKRYSNSQTGIVDLKRLFAEDTIIRNDINKCYSDSKEMVLLNVYTHPDTLFNLCFNNFNNKYKEKIDTHKLSAYCRCQIDLIKEKKIKDDEFDQLSNPNSLIHYQFYSRCGSPFIEKDSMDRNWNINSKKFVEGPEADTIKMLNLRGMSYVKIKIGKNKQIWLFDSGASDLLLTKETEEQLKKDGIITPESFIGIKEYEMANGTVDTCRKYLINGIQLGNYKINNVTVAVSDKTSKVILGRSVLNRFEKWILDNSKSYLILVK